METNKSLNTVQPSQPISSGQSLDWSRLAKVLDSTNKVGISSLVTLAEARAVVAQPTPPICSYERAVTYAEYMGKAMPTGQGTDFDIWLKDAAIIFSEYAEADVRLCVEHPIKGLRAKHKWLPQPVDLVEFLNGLRGRRYRIVANARHVVAELSAPAEAPETPEHRDMMARRFENLSRELSGKLSLEVLDSVREQQEIFDAECVAAGNGDKQAGLMILLGPV